MVFGSGVGSDGIRPVRKNLFLKCL